MEWLNGPKEDGNMEVDIGYVPRMELISSVASTKAIIEVNDGKTGIKTNISMVKQFTKPVPHDVYKEIIKGIKWNKEITVEEALIRLEKSFYPFKEVVKLRKIYIWAFFFHVFYYRYHTFHS